MDRNAVVLLFLLLFLAADVSDASLLSHLRKLVVELPSKIKQTTNTTPGTLMPSPAPQSVANLLASIPNNETANNKTVRLPLLPYNSTKVDSSTPPTQSDKSNNNKINKNFYDSNPKLENVASESCDELPSRCRDLNNMVACIKSFNSVSQELIIMVQNKGDDTLKVNLSVENIHKELEILKNQTDKVNVELSSGVSSNVILNAGNGECLLHLGSPISEGNLFLRLPSYDKLVTPINGAYFLIFTVVVFGGTWGFCKLRKKRREGGGEVAYQELEMGMAESVLGTDVETTEGWDQGWDDDWDDDKAVKSPGGRISANGLTSRSSNKDWMDERLG